MLVQDGLLYILYIPYAISYIYGTEYEVSRPIYFHEPEASESKVHESECAMAKYFSSRLIYFMSQGRVKVKCESIIYSLITLRVL